MVIEDESIFHYEVTLKRYWFVKGSKPRAKVTGSKARLCVFGSLTDSGSQCYQTTEKINSVTFIEYTKHLLRRYRKMMYFLDEAPWHRSKITMAFLKKNKRRIKVVWFPKGFPESNPVEETWKQGKYDSKLGAMFHPDFKTFKQAVSRYYRAKRFRLNAYKYLCR